MLFHAGALWRLNELAYLPKLARISRNPLLVVSEEVVRGVVLELIEDKLEHASNRTSLMHAWLAHHSEVLDAIRAADGTGAAHLAKQALYDNYAEYVPAGQRPLLEPLLRP